MEKMTNESTNNNSALEISKKNQVNVDGMQYDIAYTIVQKNSRGSRKFNFSDFEAKGCLVFHECSLLFKQINKMNSKSK